MHELRCITAPAPMCRIREPPVAPFSTVLHVLSMNRTDASYHVSDSAPASSFVRAFLFFCADGDGFITAFPGRVKAAYLELSSGRAYEVSGLCAVCTALIDVDKPRTIPNGPRICSFRGCALPSDVRRLACLLQHSGRLAILSWTCLPNAEQGTALTTRRASLCWPTRY